MNRFSKLSLLAIGALLLAAPLLTLPANVLAQGAACNQTYVVEKGDWLSKIAQRFLGDSQAYNTILEATNAAAKTDSSFAALTDPNKLEVGQKLCIPAPTAIPGRENAGIYTNVGPAADASALVETIVLGGDGQARNVLDYIGKAQISSKGTWKQDGTTVTLHLYEQSGKPIDETSTYTVQNNTLVGTAAPNTVYTKTAADVAFYSGVYTTNRKSADGSQTLTALTLLPNGTAQLSIQVGDQFVMQTGTWSVGKSPDTGATMITVDTKDPNSSASEHFVFQVQGENLRGTEYNRDKWGTDVTFTKYQPPAEPQTPANTTPTPEASNPSGPRPTGAGLAPITGSYTESLPAADAIGRVIVLDLNPDNTAAFTTQFIGKGEPQVDKGNWNFDTGTVVVNLDTPNGKQTLKFVFDATTLVLQDPVAAGYGTNGLHLKRTPSGISRSADFDGVTIHYDYQLAQSAQGAMTPAVPVTEGPAFGGATPAAVRFLFNGQKAPDYFDPRLLQVNVYRADDWRALDPAFAKVVNDLQTLLKDKPANPEGIIPAVQPNGAQQVLHSKLKYLDFPNGSGVAFLTYYAQDVSPVTANQLFYSFQGLTNDGKYLVTVNAPVTTALLPADPQAALGGKSYNDWANGYEQYVKDLTAQLNGLVNAAYTPDLSLMDQLASSVEIGDTTLK